MSPSKPGSPACWGRGGGEGETVISKTCLELRPEKHTVSACGPQWWGVGWGGQVVTAKVRTGYVF